MREDILIHLLMMIVLLHYSYHHKSLDYYLYRNPMVDELKLRVNLEIYEVMVEIRRTKKFLVEQ